MDSSTQTPPASDGRSARGDTDRDGEDFRRAFLAGVVGAVVASVGYVIYSRLEDEHKDALRQTVMKFVEEKVGDLRAQFKL